MTSPIAKGDVLLFEDTDTIATVIDGSEADGWKCLNEGRGDVFLVSDLSAQIDQAHFVADPDGMPPSGSFVTVFFSDPFATRENRWNVDGYAFTNAFGDETVYAVLTNAADPARSCYVTADKVFAV
jgi:hypothetical protein